MKRFFAVRQYPLDMDITLLIIRLVSAAVFIGAGWGKIQQPFSWMPNSMFPGFLLALAAFAEFAGGIAVALGLVTRLAALGLFFTMIGAVYLHAVALGHPFMDPAGGPSYQPAVSFLLFSLVLMVAGPGKISLDEKIFGKKI